MSDIPQARPTVGVAWPYAAPDRDGGRRGHKYGTGSRSGGHDEDGNSRRRLRRPDLWVDVQGLNFTALTPEIQAVLTKLMGEIEALHEDIAVADGRIAFLEELADQHPFLPVLNRRAILRLVAGLTRTPRGQLDENSPRQPVAQVVLLSLDNFDSLRRSHGLALAEHALIHLAEALNASLRASDRLGSVGGAAFLAVLPGADPEGVRRKMAGMSGGFSYQSADIDGAKVLLKVEWAMAPLYPGDVPEEVLADVDGRLLRQG